MGAEERGGHLATITSAGEQACIGELSTEAGWLGGSDVDPNRQWVWVTSEDFVFRCVCAVAVVKLGGVAISIHIGHSAGSTWSLPHLRDVLTHVTCDTCTLTFGHWIRNWGTGQPDLTPADAVNVAAGKAASQSTDEYPDGFAMPSWPICFLPLCLLVAQTVQLGFSIFRRGDASHGVDGTTSGEFDDLSCTHTVNR